MASVFSVRGSLDAYIKAFDKHFNMLLSDIDEEYITNSVSSNYPTHFEVVFVIHLNSYFCVCSKRNGV